MMVRISKDYEVRKKEIIDTALRLFLQNGYDNTPVSLIIDTIGISKGTFYYYFKSKEELLDSIVDERTKAIIAVLTPIVQDSQMNAIEKINAIYMQALRMKTEVKEIIRSIIRIWSKDENILIRHKMEQRNMVQSAELIRGAIDQGIREGHFRLESPEGIAELLIKLGTILNDTIISLYNRYDLRPPSEELIKIMEIYQMAIERILGAPEGSIRIYDPDLFIDLISG